MKLRITEPGFKGYTGQMGIVYFENGVSTSDVSTMDATRMSAVMGFEWEDGTAASVAQHILDRANDEAQTVPVNVSSAVTETKENPAFKKYSVEELADIADTSGISGLREIAEPLGVKGKSIRDLIDGILASTK